MISSRSKSIPAELLRSFLWVAAQGYTAAIGLRNFLYSKRWLKIHITNVPVISIGNITVGGTGKTPLVIWMYRFLQSKNIPCAILTRGYKATRTDEPVILAESCPQAKVIVNPDRVEAAAEAVNKFGAKVLIMDDGFQHRRLHRDLDIVTIDATCPFGYGKMLPAGLLREPISGLKRADAVVLTRTDQVDENQLNRIEERILKIRDHIIIARAIHRVVVAKLANGDEIRPDQLKGKKVFAFCGIGNPDSFTATIKSLKCEVVGSKTYNDHHSYRQEDVREIFELADKSDIDLILTTYKDWTKIDFLKILYSEDTKPTGYLEIELKFISGEDKITQLIQNALAGKIPS